MTDYGALSLAELENRMAITRDNIRQLIEQAAGASGDRNEERIAERIEQQNAELEALEKARDALTAVGADVSYRELDDLSHCYPREINPAILEWLAGEA